VRGVSNPEAHKLILRDAAKTPLLQDEEESKNMEKRNAAVAVIGAGELHRRRDRQEIRR